MTEPIVPMDARRPPAPPTDAGVDAGTADARPRLVRPLTGTTVTVAAPTLEIAPPEGATDVRVQVCEDPTCEPFLTEVTTGPPFAASLPVSGARRTLYWRAIATIDGAPRASDTWWFEVPPSTPASAFDTSCQQRLDLDGDARGDLVVGAPGAFGADPGYQGAVLVYGGAAGSPLMVTPPPDAGVTDFGWAIDAAGDVDGDGAIDLLVGAPTLSGIGGGAAFVIRDLRGVWTFDRLDLPDARSFGISVAGVGDVDGDGYADVAVMDGDDARVAVFRGGPAGVERTPAWVLTPPIAGITNARVFRGGDLDGDRRDDLVTAFPFAAPGQIFVYLGAELDDPTPLPAGPDLNTFGTALATGDFRERGRCHLMISAPGEGAAAGRVQEVTFDPERRVMSLGGSFQTGAARFGESLAAPDLDGDGIDDLVVGTDGGSRVDAYLLRLTRTESVTVPAGRLASALGDTDGDGYGDFAVGTGAEDEPVWVTRGAAAPMYFRPIVDLPAMPTGVGFGLAIR